MLTGPTALAWSTDPVAAAKATVEFARTNDKLVLIGGALGPQTLDASGVRALAELPSLDALRARIVGMIATPATRVAGVLQASAGQLARVFGAFARKNEEAEAADGRLAPGPRMQAGNGGPEAGLHGTNQRLD